MSNNTLKEFLLGISDDLLMARIYMGKQVYPENGLVPDDIYRAFSQRFLLTDDGLTWIGKIHNFLYLPVPTNEPLINAFCSAFTEIAADEATIGEQWGLVPPDELEVMTHAFELRRKMQGHVFCLQSLLASYAVLYNSTDPSINDHYHSDMTFAYQRLKDYWAVALLPFDETRLFDSWFLKSRPLPTYSIGSLFQTSQVTIGDDVYRFHKADVVDIRKH